ncbi:hypothetical protein Poly30_56540 [Planctomycetes bacterium Poly30]|uniref:DUF6265 domain-containing protein n=1 Tax=Saltatorellus ferox TaxID=2528018 RepID=A0A518F173_9BACT|nr:hypothetical protein Poly30_56540 [Planctomycetes bacterium Poly30]
MQRTLARPLALGLLFSLTSCLAADKPIFDELDARAQSGNRAATPGTPPPGSPSGSVAPVADGIPIPQTGPVLPRNAAEAPEIAGLRFLHGSWIAVNPNKTVNEETWTLPRGNFLMGTFRQIRLDGDCAFVELSQIALEEGEIVLRLRHMHGRLEVPEGRADISQFKLVSLTKDRVEFAGVNAAESVKSVIYERLSATELQQSILFAPESGEKDFVTRYTLDR